MDGLRAAVVGHLEWVEFVRVPRHPEPGEIAHASEWWKEPAGGGPVAAEQLRKLGAHTSFFTALGDDELGHRAAEDLGERGLDVHAVFRPEPTRRAFCHVDSAGERTITVIGERLAPRGDDDLPWDLMNEMDAVYFTAGDQRAVKAARAAKIVSATARALTALQEAGVVLDALVGSAVDAGERFSPSDLQVEPRLSVWTDGARGGRWEGAGRSGLYSASPLPGPPVDRYGAGDSFAGGLTFGLGRGLPLEEALELAADCGAAAVCGRGPYRSQLARRRLGEPHQDGR